MTSPQNKQKSVYRNRYDQYQQFQCQQQQLFNIHSSQTDDHRQKHEQQYQYQQQNYNGDPLKHLTPANQILGKHIKSDSPTKITIRHKYGYQHNKQKQKQEEDKQRLYEKQKGICKNIDESIVEKMCFQEEETLGYEYQSKFGNRLVYARVFDGIAKKDWKKFITYMPPDSINQRQSITANKGIKYLAGIFPHNLKQPSEKSQITPSQFHPLSSAIQNINKPHLLDNNFSIFTSLKQKNYQPSLIQFTASYPSANLMYAFRTGYNQFTLILHNDTNSKGSTQWFNFGIILPQMQQQHNNNSNSNGNSHSNNNNNNRQLFQNIKFNIVNLTKASSVYERGMKILYRKKKDNNNNNNNNSNNNNWKRLQCNVEYYKNNIDIQGRQQGTKYRTLSFTFDTKLIKFTNNEQIIQFAYGYPYGFDDCYKFWQEVERISYQSVNTKKFKNKFVLKKEIIARSSSNMPIEAYRIMPQDKKKSVSTANINLQNQSNMSNKLKNIVFLGRQHPGQTQGSYIIEGIVDAIFNNNQPSHLQNMKKNFIYNFIPIVNVEGVLLGNYRTNLKGYDLNRNWRNPTVQGQPQIVSIKNYLQKINKQNQICLIIDLHGHSKAINSFFYGVDRNNKNKQNTKIFPYFCSKKLKQVKFEQCYFSISQDKKNTARVVLSQLFPRSLAYTLQNSFYGYQITEKNNVKIVQYTPNQLKKFGNELLMTYFQYLQLEISGNSQKMLMNQIKNKMPTLNKQILEKQIEQFGKNKQSKDKNNNADISSCKDSDSQASLQLLDLFTSQQNPKLITPSQDTQKQNKIPQNNPSINPLQSLLQQSQAAPLPFSIKPRKKGLTFAIKNQGTYLKTIQMIQTTRSQLNDQYYIHKIQRSNGQKQKNNNRRSYSKCGNGNSNTSGNRRKIIRGSLQKTQQYQNQRQYGKFQQKQNISPLNLLPSNSNSNNNKKIPLLSINMIKPRTVTQEDNNNNFNNKYQNLLTGSRRSHNNHTPLNIKFINQKQLAFQEVRKRRIQACQNQYQNKYDSKFENKNLFIEQNIYCAGKNRSNLVKKNKYFYENKSQISQKLVNVVKKRS